MMPIQLLKGNESAKTESVASFVKRVTSDWNLARENLQRSVGLQQKYYDQKHRDVHYNVGDLVLLSTTNLRMKGTPAKLQRRFVGPFKVVETIGQQAYKLSLSEDWKRYPVFHASLLKDWRTASLHVMLALRPDCYCACLGALPRNAHMNNNATTTRDTQTKPQDQPEKETNRKLYTIMYKDMGPGPPFLPQTLHTIPCASHSLTRCLTLYGSRYPEPRD